MLPVLSAGLPSCNQSHTTVGTGDRPAFLGLSFLLCHMQPSMRSATRGL